MLLTLERSDPPSEAESSDSAQKKRKAPSDAAPKRKKKKITMAAYARFVHCLHETLDDFIGSEGQIDRAAKCPGGVLPRDVWAEKCAAGGGEAHERNCDRLFDERYRYLVQPCVKTACPARGPLLRDLDRVP